MPFRANFRGKDVVACDLGREQWEELRAEVKEAGEEELLLPCCGVRACLRTSKKGLQHFYHYRRGACDYEGESLAHLTLKFAVLKAAQVAGFEADVEVGGDGWVADVLVSGFDQSRRGWRMAFEIQLSSQSPAKVRSRHGDRLASMVWTCWLVPWGGSIKPPPEATRELPVFLCTREQEVEVGRQRLSINDFVDKWLKRQIVLSKSEKRQKQYLLHLFPLNCWQCRKRCFGIYCESRSRLTWDDGTVGPWTSDFTVPLAKMTSKWLPRATKLAEKHAISLGTFHACALDQYRDATVQSCIHCAAILDPFDRPLGSGVQGLITQIAHESNEVCVHTRWSVVANQD